MSVRHSIVFAIAVILLSATAERPVAAFGVNGMNSVEPGTAALFVVDPVDPDTADEAIVDRFAEGTGMLFVRDDMNGFPEAGEPIDFDEAPFITRGLAADGRSVLYYNFDVMPRESVPIYVLFREGEEAPVEDQLNIVGVIPGDEGYSDFWHVHRVIVPEDYEANTLTSEEDVMTSGHPIERTDLIVNCPIVPAGSTADMRFNDAGDTGLVRGWYESQLIYYFDFSERMLTVEVPDEGHPMVPISPIYVTFNINPGEDGGGPPSGFVAEEGSDQTHNVIATLPADEAYSPLWSVNPYDNADFEAVHDLASAQTATILAMGVALVNCPVVFVGSEVGVESLGGALPERFELHGNYPNPFNPETTIRYGIPEAGHVTLTIYDLLGKPVIELVNASQSGGEYRATWDGRGVDGRSVATGVYVYRLSVDGRASEARTMLLLK